MQRAIVIGSSGGIGGAVADRLQANGVAVRRVSRSVGDIDLTDEASIVAAGLTPDDRGDCFAWDGARIAP